LFLSVKKRQSVFGIHIHFSTRILLNYYFPRYTRVQSANTNTLEKYFNCALQKTCKKLAKNFVRGSRCIAFPILNDWLYILTHILGKHILQTYLDRCLFLFLQAFLEVRSRLQILHSRVFSGLRPDFLMSTNFHGTLFNPRLFVRNLSPLANSQFVLSNFERHLQLYGGVCFEWKHAVFS
jgi:hypothetical protein